MESGNSPSPHNSQEQRRQQLIEATIRIIARHGLSNTTLARVAQDAGLSAGIVNFYFTSKDTLLLATLRHLSNEFMAVLENAVAASGTEPGENLIALIEAMFDPVVSHPDRVAVWYAFWGEAAARGDYMKVCGGKDEAYQRAVQSLIAQLTETAPPEHPLDIRAVTSGLTGLLDEQWQTILLEQERFDRRDASRLARAYLASVFPWRFQQPKAENTAGGAEIIALPLTLPAWTYGNAEFFQLEKEQIFKRTWQLLGHVSDVKDPGDYLTLDLLGERAFVIRGKDGKLRAFHNVCRHRAHAVVTGTAGNCAGVLRCPYHGWLYNLDGRLRAIPAEKSFPGANKDDLGLIPLEMEVFLGFVFVRFGGEGASVAERFKPYADEMAAYRTEEMVPVGDGWQQEVEVDWKNVLDNFLEGYHVPASHPGLYDLFGSHYEAEAKGDGAGRALHWIKDEAAKGWSQRAYQRLLPSMTHLPDERRRAWSYYSLFPAVLLDFYADSVDYFQIVPLDAGRTALRGQHYALPNASRELKAAIYLNQRINTLVQREDTALTASVQSGLASSAYGVGVLSEKEGVLRAFHDWIRQALPVARSLTAPKAGTLAQMNERR